MRRINQAVDEVFSEEIVIDHSENLIHRRLYQPERDATMGAVKDLRNSGMVQDTPTGANWRWCLSIPYDDLEALRRSVKWCELFAPDRETSQRAWRRFMQSSDSAPYRVRERAN